jgi:aspartate aminotransferase
MFETLAVAPPDKIMGLAALFRSDPRPDKIDLGVGVYKDSSGATVIMRAVREAETRLFAEQTTKTYMGMAGDEGFNAAMIRMVFGAGAASERLFCGQTAGGTAALRLLAELLAKARPEATVWLPNPTWPIHEPIFRTERLRTASYPYFDAATGRIRFDDMLAGLRAAKPGDIVMLHGCCHNPTGTNLSPDQWARIADLVHELGLFPFVDLAYQGFGDGLEADAAGARLLAGRVPEMAVATSCSKNFSVYRDRVGAMLLLCRDADSARVVASQALMATRIMYSMPPDHAAAAIRIILQDEALTADWKAELESMRLRLQTLRADVTLALRRHANSGRFDFIAEHRGMFSRLGITEAQVERLRAEFGIYMTSDSRFNIAGLREKDVERFARTVVSVL